MLRLPSYAPAAHAGLTVYPALPRAVLMLRFPSCAPAALAGVTVYPATTQLAMFSV